MAGIAGKRQKRRLNARTARKVKAKFLAAYARLGNATAVEQETGISRYHHKHWLKSSEEYRKAFEQADDQATELLEIEARRRATGHQEPVFYNGQQIGSVTKYSDLLLIFLLKAKRPDIYRERFDTKINNSLNVQNAVKIVHHYEETPPTIDVTALESHPNKALMAATPSPLPPQPVVLLTEDKVGKGNSDTPLNLQVPDSLARGTSTSTTSLSVLPEQPSQPLTTTTNLTEEDIKR